MNTPLVLLQQEIGGKMNWRPNDWQNPHKHSDSVQAWDILEAYCEVSDEEWITFEAGADALLNTLLPQLKTIHSMLCGIRMKEGKTSWYSALDANIDYLAEIINNSCSLPSH